MRRGIAVLFLLALAATAAADTPKEKASIVSIELGKGVQPFVREKASAQVQQGLIAAGYEVVPPDTKDKTTAQVTVNITRKLDSTIIVMKMTDPATGDAIADIHEVCDLCGQDELEERIGVAASALRAKAAAERNKRLQAAQASAPQPPAPPAEKVVAGPGPLHVAVVPGIAVNMDTARVDALSQDLAEALNSELDVVATGGLEVRRQLPADGLPADCVTNPTCTNNVAHRTGASQLLFVVMVDTGAGGSIQIDTTWIDAATGKSASRPALDLTSTSEAKAKFASSATVLLPDAPVRKKPANGGGGIGVNTKMTDAEPRHLSTAAKVTAGVAVAGLGVGIALGITTRSRYNKCDGDPVNCTSSDKDSIRKFGLGADAGFVIATGCAIATIVMYATYAKESRLIVAPGPTSDGNGAALTAIGRF